MELHITTISKTVIDGLVYSLSGRHHNYLFGVMLLGLESTKVYAKRAPF